MLGANTLFTQGVVIVHLIHGLVVKMACFKLTVKALANKVHKQGEYIHNITTLISHNHSYIRSGDSFKNLL